MTRTETWPEVPGPLLGRPGLDREGRCEKTPEGPSLPWPGFSERRGICSQALSGIRIRGGLDRGSEAAVGAPDPEHDAHAGTVDDAVSVGVGTRVANGILLRSGQRVLVGVAPERGREPRGDEVVLINALDSVVTEQSSIRRVEVFCTNIARPSSRSGPLITSDIDDPEPGRPS